jgi:hypothetical protein
MKDALNVTGKGSRRSALALRGAAQEQKDESIQDLTAANDPDALRSGKRKSATGRPATARQSSRKQQGHEAAAIPTLKLKFKHERKK